MAIRVSSIATLPTARMVREPPPIPTSSYFTPISCCFSGLICTVPGAIVERSSVGAFPSSDGAAEAAPPSAYTGSSFIPQSGAIPGRSDLYAGCIGSTQ